MNHFRWILMGSKILQSCSLIRNRFRFFPKLWNFVDIKKSLMRNAGKIMFGCAGVYSYDWDKERIQLNSFLYYLDELNDDKGSLYQCKCDGSIENYNGEIIDDSLCPPYKREWIPYYSKQNLMIWRREEKPGLYAYKVHANLPDVTPEEFFYVQIDIEYRKKWDKSLVNVEILETDPIYSSSSHIIYWEMTYPRFFSNRDYVFNRRYFVEPTRKLILLINRNTKHHKCPEKSQPLRVGEYWSHMLIRAYTEFDKPGLEYVLTYFDNPGVSLPSAITSFINKKQLPEFLRNVHEATKAYSIGSNMENTLFAFSHRLSGNGITIKFQESDESLEDNIDILITGEQSPNNDTETNLDNGDFQTFDFTKIEIPGSTEPEFHEGDKIESDHEGDEILPENEDEKSPTIIIPACATTQKEKRLSKDDKIHSNGFPDDLLYIGTDINLSAPD